MATFDLHFLNTGLDPHHLRYPQRGPVPSQGDLIEAEWYSSTAPNGQEVLVRIVGKVDYVTHVYASGTPMCVRVHLIGVVASVNPTLIEKD